MPDILRQYYDRYYKKNIYTPKRFVKAFKRYWVSDGEEVSELGAVVVDELHLVADDDRYDLDSCALIFLVV
jgi:hypothetical protein